ncbi:hypothetical protein HY990_05690 [Candidatus Micrarchaeota archaeon]|nr:hypothetical protein [Candidatus Micrarchaeota archaeon]
MATYYTQDRHSRTSREPESPGDRKIREFRKFGYPTIGIAPITIAVAAIKFIDYEGSAARMREIPGGKELECLVRVEERSVDALRAPRRAVDETTRQQILKSTLERTRDCPEIDQRSIRAIAENDSLTDGEQKRAISELQARVEGQIAEIRQNQPELARAQRAKMDNKNSFFMWINITLITAIMALVSIGDICEQKDRNLNGKREKEWV